MATDTKAAEGAAEAAGMPQLDFSTFPNQMFWLVVTLVIIYLVLSRVALPRIAVRAVAASVAKPCRQNGGPIQ